MSLKNKGEQLVSKFKGLLDNVPVRWRAKLGITKTTQKVPLDESLTNLGEGVVASQLVQEQNNERAKTDTTIDDPIGQILVEYIRTEHGQVGTREVKYLAEGTPLPTFDELTVDAGQEASGNGYSEQFVITVPNLFQGFDYSIERRDTVPPEFSALLKTYEISDDVAGTAAMPTLAAGELMRREVQKTEQVKRVTVRYRDLATLPQTLVDKDTDEHKQVVTVTKTWLLESATPPAPTATTDVKFNRLGDGTAIQIVLGVLNVFGGNDYTRERRDTVPPDFGALLEVTEFTETVAGTAADPTLGTGELYRSETQVTEFTKRVKVRARDVASLPKTLVNKDTDNNKQVVTITRIWELASTTPAVPTSSLDVKFEKLGDGTAIETRTVIPAVFPGPVYVKSIENLIPPQFRAKIPTYDLSSTAIGTANGNPTLATGEISHSEQQIDEFNLRTKIVIISVPSPPISFTHEENTEEFGGGTLDIIYTLHTVGSLTIDTGLRVVNSGIVDLGNGYEIRTTKRLQDSAWPENAGQDYDERLDVILPFTQQVVAAGSNLGDARTEIKPIDAWRQQNRTIDISAIEALLAAFVLSYATKVNIDMPDLLTAVESVMESVSSEGAQDETGTIAFTGDYSISMSLRATAQSSATLLPDLILTIKQFFGANIDATAFQFFLASPVTPADVLTKIVALVGGSVSAWPKFNPEIVTIKTVGQKLSLQVVATSQGSAAVSGSGSSSTAAGGTGLSQESQLMLKTVRISSTIHDEIVISGDTSDTVSISADASAEATGLGPAEDSSESGSVNASVDPTTIPATVGAITWPTTGKFLLRVDAEPYRFGFIQFHCIVVDAADFPNN